MLTLTIRSLSGSPIVSTLILMRYSQPALGPSTFSSLLSHVRTHLSAWVFYSYRNETTPVRYFPCLQVAQAQSCFFLTAAEDVAGLQGFRGSLAGGNFDGPFPIWGCGEGWVEVEPTPLFFYLAASTGTVFKENSSNDYMSALNTNTSVRELFRVWQWAGPPTIALVPFACLGKAQKDCQGPRGSFKMRLGASLSPYT